MIKKANFNLLFSFLFISLIGCNGPLPKPTPVAGTILKITVIDRKLQQPIPQARISLKKDNDQIGSVQVTDETGQTTFKDVDEGDGYIAFVNNATGYKSGASPLIKVVAPSTEANVFLDRIGNGEGTGLIAGSAKDKTTGKPIDRLTVTYVGPKGSKSILTDETGSFVIEGLVAGNYVVTFTKAGYAQAKKQMTVVDGQSTNIETVFLARQGNVTSSGNYLVSLSGSKKAVELNKSGSVIWSYSQLGGIESASRINSGDTIITDGNSSRVLQISNSGSVLKSFGANAIFSSLKYPSWVDSVDGANVLVTDNGANKVIEFNSGKTTWSYATGLNRPRSAVYLNNGNILITDTGNRRVIEVNRDGNVIWTYSDHMDKPVHAVRLANGNTLITDSGYSRIIEVDYKGLVKWWFAGPTSADTNGSGGTNNGSNSDNIIDTPDNNNPGVLDTPTDRDTGISSVKKTPVKKVTNTTLKTKADFNSFDADETPSAPGNTLLFPRSAVRLDNGNTLVADTGNNRIIEVSQQKSVVFELGNLPRPVSVERL